MKKLLLALFTFLSIMQAQAKVDTIVGDSFCFVYIALEATGGSAELVAYAFDLDDPNGTDFSYDWSTGDTSMSIPFAGAGTYCVTATSNGSGCEAEFCTTINNQTCGVSTWQNFDGTMTAFGFGLPPYDYIWDTGDTTNTIDVVAGETYCVTVTDGLGCQADTCVIAEEFPIDTFCFAQIFHHVDSNGEIILTAFGSGIIFPPNNGDETYEWSTGDTSMSIIATDPTGTYCVTITTGSCVSEACIELDNLGCELWIGCDPPGTFTAISSGLPPFSYIWDTGDTTQTIDVTTGETYCVTVTDALGCVADGCMTADSIIFPPTDTFCDVFIDVEANPGGIELTAQPFAIWGFDFTYEWSTGDTTKSIIGLPGGSYCVTVTSLFDGCEATACIDLDEYDCSDLYVLCDPGNILAVLSGGLPPFSYEWSTGDTTEYIMAEIDSTYCVTITDAVDCVVDTCITFTGFPIDTNDIGSLLIGAVYTDDTVNAVILEGTVYLYEKNAQDMFDLVDSTMVQTNGIFGGYAFNVQAGTYITKAVVSDLNTGDDYIPTYHFNALEWSEADEIVVVPMGPAGPFTLYEANIELLGTTSLTGPGIILGNLLDISDLLSSHSRDENAIHAVTLILTDAAGNTLTYVMSDENGEFSFDNIPYGSYRLYADHLRFSGPYLSITLSEANPEARVTIEVDEDQIMLDNRDIDISEYVDIYPNPASSQLFVDVSDHSAIKQFELIDINGAIIRSVSELNTQSIYVNISDVATGMYSVRLITEEGMAIKKVMIIN